MSNYFGKDKSNRLLRDPKLLKSVKDTIIKAIKFNEDQDYIDYMMMCFRRGYAPLPKVEWIDNDKVDEEILTDLENFSVTDISSKLLELARDKKGIPVTKVEIYDNDYGDTEYKFYTDDASYIWYFDGKWYTLVKCMNDIQNMIKNMLNLHFPDGKVTDESFNREVMVRKNFSDRLMKCFSKY